MFKFDMMTFNKIAGALLSAALIIMGLNILADTIYHPKAPAKAAINIEVADEGGADAGKSAEPEASLASLLASADAGAGQKVFKKCTACHTGDKGGANKTGPNLYGVVGRGIGAAGGFKYSDVLAGKSGENWSYENLDAFLSNPKGFAKGTKMSFKLKKASDRASLLAYLRTLSDSPVALPTE